MSKNPPRPLIKTLPDRHHYQETHSISHQKRAKRGPPSNRCLGGGATVDSRFHLRGSEVEPTRPKLGELVRIAPGYPAARPTPAL